MFYVCTNYISRFCSVFSLLGMNCLYFSFIILLSLYAKAQASELYSASFL